MAKRKTNPYEDENEVEHYIEMLHSNDFFERTTAIVTLGWLGDERAVEPLIETLKSLDSAMAGVNYALIEIWDERAVEPLIDYYKITKNNFGAKSLGKLKDKRAIPVLLNVLKNEQNPSIRKYAVQALGQIGGAELVEPLIEALKTNSKIQASISNALGELGEVAVLPLLELLNTDDSNKDYDRVKAYAAHALGKLKDKRAVEPLIAILNTETDDNKVRKNVAYALGSIGYPQAIEPLIKSFSTSTFKETRSSIIQALGTLGGEQSLPIIVEAVYDKNHKVQRAAILALSILGNDLALSELLKIIENKQLTKNIRVDAISALYKFADNEHIVDSLLAIVTDETENISVRSAVMGKVSKFKQKNTSAVFMQIFRESESVPLRIAAMDYLGQLGATEAVEPLIEALQDPELWNSAAIALANLADKRAVEPIFEAIQKFGMGVQEARVLGAFHDPRTVDILSVAAKSEDYSTNRYAVQALGEIADPKSIQVLIEALKNEDFAIRGEAVLGLIKIGDESAIPELERVARTDTGEIYGYGGDEHARIRDAAADAITQIRQRAKQNH
jgi:HEAT repeat protein